MLSSDYTSNGMKQESRLCQNCKNEFVIEPEDFAFYEKISVPPPTWCPECRMMRRMSFGNHLNMYKRKDDLNKKEILSVYDKDAPFPVYTTEDWWSDKWDPLQFGREYNFKVPFFSQFLDLYHKVPQMNLVNINSINCDYCPKIVNAKSCYLSIGFGIENCIYGYYSRCSKDSISYFNLNFSEKCYECVDCYKCYSLFFSQDCVECYDSKFLIDCRNCHDCFGCVNLRNRSFCIFNKQYTKEEYKKIMNEYDFGSNEGIKQAMEKLSNLKISLPRRYSILNKCSNVTGNHVSNSIDSFDCFDISEDSSLERVKYLIVGSSMRDCYDSFTGGEGIELSAEFMLTFGGRNNFATINVLESYNVKYSIDCYNSSNLFGCVGLRKKEYCILNKQFTKKEYDVLLPKIIQNMIDNPFLDNKGRIYKYGEFFPDEFSPFAYNKTVAQENFPLKKEQVLDRGYSWKDREKRNYQVTIKSKDLPDHIKDVQDNILNQVIGCEHEGKCNEQCTEAFRIIPQELKFYREMNLALPKLCPNCRHYQRMKQRSPLKLWQRACMCEVKNHGHEEKCQNEFETSYAPDRPEIVYCEACYKDEVS
ncbi:MAG: putative phage protein [Parcubacteria group bacterium GW2011_GWA2_45_30]|nr:MAG: putative phage protein [Parcubacteria group bacterium GW2011_GWA2_45_30]